MMELRKSYMDTLSKLQVGTLCVEAAICTSRLFGSETLSILYLLSLIQPVLLYLVVLKKHNIAQCQIYIVVAVVMIYLLLWKEVVVLYGLPLFPSMYHLYWLELVFRGWSVHVGRRSYCAYKVFVAEGVMEEDGMESELSFLP